ncbi:MAG TPA: hypothetical protein VGS11_05575 [Candidatus Bathyarchaeia archaeon]|nr:hypothetical protein [Candidatus Bathyarchaeia archaeon]
MSARSRLPNLAWAASIVTIILGVLPLVSLFAVFRFHTVESGALKSASALALPWAWLGSVSAIPLFWLFLIGWILGIFVAIGTFSRRRKPRQPEPNLAHERHSKRKDHGNHQKSHLRVITAIAAIFMVVLAVGGMTIFLVPPTTSNPGQGHGPGGSGQGNGGGGSGGGSMNLASLSDRQSQVDQISDPKGLGYSGQRKMATDNNGNTYIAYRKAPPGLTQSEIYVAMSKDGGKTWTDLGGGPVAIVNAPPLVSGTTQGGGTGTDQRVPSIAIDSKNQIHVVWYGRDSIYTGANERQVKYSKWNGAAWLPWINLSPVLGYSGSTYWQEHPVIVVGKNDVLHVIWEGSDSSSVGVQQIKHSMSTNGGATWTTWENIAPINPSGQSRPDAVVDPNGNLYATWYGGVSGTTGTRIKYARWDAGSMTWAPVQIVAAIDGYSQKHVSLAIDKSNTLRLVWDGPDDSNSNSLVKYSSLNLSLSSPVWSAWTNVNPGTWLNQSDPMISIGPSGIVLVAWQEWKGTDALTATNASVFIMIIGASQSKTQLGSSLSGNNKWPVMTEDSSGGVVRIGWLSGQGVPYTICYSQTSLKSS